MPKARLMLDAYQWHVRSCASMGPPGALGLGARGVSRQLGQGQGGRLGLRRAAPILDKDEPASNDCVALRQGRVLCYDQGRFAAYQLVRLRLAACQWHVLGLLHAKGTS